MRISDVLNPQHAEWRGQAQTDQDVIKLRRLRPQVRPFSHPRPRVLAELHPACVGVDPVTPDDLCLGQREPSLSIGLAGEGTDGSTVDTVRSLIASLPAARRQTANTAEAALARHQATLRGR